MTDLANLAFTPELRQRMRANLEGHELSRLAADGLRHAAVGVVVLPDEAGRACFVLTRRLATLRGHSGQWALPGGRLEPGESPETAARREIHEEVGLELPGGARLGQLDDFATRSGYLISPLVFWAETDSVLIASPDEVDAIYRVRLDELARPAAVQFEPLLHFDLAQLPSAIHAPTAAILYQFREVGLFGRDVRVTHIEQPPFAWR